MEDIATLLEAETGRTDKFYSCPSVFRKGFAVAMAAFDTEEIVETGTGEQIDTTTSGSGMFSLFRRRPQADVFNHPYGIIGPLITRYGNGLSVLPNKGGLVD